MHKRFPINADKSFIEGWFLEDLSICDRLIDFFENNDNKKQGMIGTTLSHQCDKSIKDSIDLSDIQNYAETHECVQEYLNELESILNHYREIYSFCDQTGVWGLENLNLQKYNSGGAAYHLWHFERATKKTSNRHLVFMTYLNDIENYGETEFYYQKIRIKPIKGLTLIWPVDWTHTHRGLPSYLETKYIITGWYEFK